MSMKTLQEEARERAQIAGDLIIRDLLEKLADRLDALEVNIEGYRKRISALEAENAQLRVNIERADYLTEAAETQLAELRENVRCMEGTIRKERLEADSELAEAREALEKILDTCAHADTCSFALTDCRDECDCHMDIAARALINTSACRASTCKEGTGDETS